MTEGISKSFNQEPMPKGFLDFEHFVQDLTAAVRSTKMPLGTPEERHAFAQKILSEMLAVEEADLADIEYLVDHASDEKSGVMRRVVNGDDTEETKRRLHDLYDEIVEFEGNRSAYHAPRKDTTTEGQ